jgi:hypothetical protein
VFLAYVWCVWKFRSDHVAVRKQAAVILATAVTTIAVFRMIVAVDVARRSSH